MLSLIALLTILEGPISFDVKDVPLDQALEELIAANNLPIIFQSAQLSGVRISASCQSCSVGQALSRLLKDTGFDWHRVDNQYVLVRKSILLGSISGMVLHGQSAEPLGFITVVAVPSERIHSDRRIRVLSAVSDRDGRFAIEGIPEGSYRLHVSSLGIESFRSEPLDVLADHTASVTLNVDRISIPIQEMVVVPGWYALLAENPGLQQNMTRAEVNVRPHLGDDVFRTINSLPGTGSDDFSAKFWVRGGLNDEVQVFLDGMELVDPFHVKDMNGVFSIIDVEAVGEVNVMTGGFPAEYGGKMSGVMEIQSATPRERKSEVGLTLSNLRMIHEGRFGNGLGSYLFSARTGNLGPLLLLKEVADQDEFIDFTQTPFPTYYDGLLRLTYAFSEHLSLSFNVLGAKDLLLFERNQATIDTEYQQGYTWINLDQSWGSHALETTIYRSETRQHRVGQSEGPIVAYDLSDRRRDVHRGINQMLTLNLRDRIQLRWGWAYREVSSRIDYDVASETTDPLYLALSAPVKIRQFHGDDEGEESSMFVALRFRITEQLILEGGARYDRQSYLDETQDPEQWSPRVHLSWQKSETASIRLSYGLYYQPQELHERQVEDGVMDFRRTALAEHWLAGWVQRLPARLELRLEAYFKDFKRLSPRFENIYDENAVDPIELMPDRFEVAASSGEAKGIELALEQQVGRFLDWRLNHAYAIVDEVVNGEVIPRQRDQRHTVNLDLGFRMGEKWNANLAFHFHTGRPKTTLYLQQVQGPDGPEQRLTFDRLYDDRYDDYRRVDVRVSRHFRRTQDRGFSFFLDMTNLFNHENARGIDGLDVVNDELVINEDLGLRGLLSFGFSWVF